MRLACATVVVFLLAASSPRVARAGDGAGPPGLAPAVARPVPPAPSSPADRPHVALELLLIAGSSSAVHSPHPSGGAMAQVGVAILVATRGMLFGGTYDEGMVSFDVAGSHTAALAGIERHIQRAWHLHVLGEIGVHHFEDLGSVFLSQHPVGGQSEGDLLYGGVRTGLTLESRLGFYLRGSVLARVDLGSADRQVVVEESDFCFFGCSPPVRRTETWTIGGTEIGASIGAGWKF